MDKFCANILEGRVGIMIDGIPIVYIVPVDINSFMQAPEDYALNFMQSSFFRFSAVLQLIYSPDAAGLLGGGFHLPSGNDTNEAGHLHHRKPPGRPVPNLY